METPDIGLVAQARADHLRLQGDLRQGPRRRQAVLESELFPDARGLQRKTVRFAPASSIVTLCLAYWDNEGPQEMDRPAQRSGALVSFEGEGGRSNHCWFQTK